MIGNNFLLQMRSQLETTRMSMTTQQSLMKDILTKSNAILLKAEGFQGARTKLTANGVSYAVHKETILQLLQIITKYSKLVEAYKLGGLDGGSNWEEYRSLAIERVNYLRSVTRKMNALKEVVDRIYEEVFAANEADEECSDDVEEPSSE